MTLKNTFSDPGTFLARLFNRNRLNFLALKKVFEMLKKYFSTWRSYDCVTNTLLGIIILLYFYIVLMHCRKNTITMKSCYNLGIRYYRVFRITL